MDWLRRNWPDLLIGIALVAVIAGIVATLLGGSSFLPFGQQGPVETSRQFTSPSAPQPMPPAGVPAAAEEAGEAIIPVVPTEGQVPVDTAPEAAQLAPPPPAEAEASPITPAAPQPQPEPTQPSPTPPAAQPQQPPAGATASLQEPSYRVGVGAFANEENANRRAQQFRNEGYPVFIGRQAELFLVLVGPYAEASEANAVAARIREAGLESDPRIFSYTPSEQAAAPTPAPATTQTPPATAAPAAEGRRYLQVGAYNSLQSAQPQRERMQEMGFEVTVRELERDNRTLYRLLIGPFAPAELAAAQERLNALGIENFATD
jgi:cell division protein FtsN